MDGDLVMMRTVFLRFGGVGQFSTSERKEGVLMSSRLEGFRGEGGFSSSSGNYSMVNVVPLKSEDTLLPSLNAVRMSCTVSWICLVLFVGCFSSPFSLGRLPSMSWMGGKLKPVRECLKFIFSVCVS